MMKDGMYEKEKIHNIILKITYNRFVYNEVYDRFPRLLTVIWGL